MDVGDDFAPEMKGIHALIGMRTHIPSEQVLHLRQQLKESKQNEQSANKEMKAMVSKIEEMKEKQKEAESRHATQLSKTLAKQGKTKMVMSMIRFYCAAVRQSSSIFTNNGFPA